MKPEQADKIIYTAILNGEDFLWKDCPSFSSDPSAWTPELYQWIEKQPLCTDFIFNLKDEVMLDCPFPEESVSMLFMGAASTPEQRAIALALAIEEKGGKG